jgi:hypothetical protein
MSKILMCAWVSPAVQKRINNYVESYGVSEGEALEALLLEASPQADEKEGEVFSLSSTDTVQQDMASFYLEELATCLGSTATTNSKRLEEIQWILRSQFQTSL